MLTMWAAVATRSVQPDRSARIEINGSHDDHLPRSHAGHELQLNHSRDLGAKVRQGGSNERFGDRLDGFGFPRW